MAFHKHGFFSFSVKVQRMSSVGGDSFVADIVALRHHGPTGAATPLEVPVIAEQYGETVSVAEQRAVEMMGQWLDRHAPAIVEPHATPRLAQSASPPRAVSLT